MENSCNTLLPQIKETRACNCKYSKCLKLYCECFSSGSYCQDCNCLNCFNKPEHEETRTNKVKTVLIRDPLAFRPKIPLDPQTLNFHPAPHFKGCNCKKTKCVKKYCECYSAGLQCCESCKCSHWYYLASKNKKPRVLNPVENKDPLYSYLKVLSEGLKMKMENEEDLKSEGSSTICDDSGTRNSENRNYERFEACFFDKILEILNRFRAY